MAGPESIEGQVDELLRCVGELCHEVRQVPEGAFTAPLGGWSPRDIVAHLIGWNEAIVVGCGQLLRGELPFYDIDPGPDYSNINKRFVCEWRSLSRVDLLGHLEHSAGKLTRFLHEMEASEWSRDSGVEHQGEHLTVRDTVSDLVKDYKHHSIQIRDWVETGSPG